MLGLLGLLGWGKLCVRTATMRDRNQSGDGCSGLRCFIRPTGAHISDLHKITPSIVVVYLPSVGKILQRQILRHRGIFSRCLSASVSDLFTFHTIYGGRKLIAGDLSCILLSSLGDFTATRIWCSYVQSSCKYLEKSKMGWCERIIAKLAILSAINTTDIFIAVSKEGLYK